MTDQTACLSECRSVQESGEYGEISDACARTIGAMYAEGMSSPSFLVARQGSRWYVVYGPTGRTVTSANTPVYAATLARRCNRALAR